MSAASLEGKTAMIPGTQIIVTGIPPL